MQNFRRPSPWLLSQNLHFNKTSRCLICTLKFEKALAQIINSLGWCKARIHILVEWKTHIWVDFLNLFLVARRKWLYPLGAAYNNGTPQSAPSASSPECQPFQPPCSSYWSPNTLETFGTLCICMCFSHCLECFISSALAHGTPVTFHGLVHMSSFLGNMLRFPQVWLETLPLLNYNRIGQ